MRVLDLDAMAIFLDDDAADALEGEETLPAVDVHVETLKRLVAYEDDATGVADFEDHRERSEIKVQHDGDVQLDVTPPGRADELAVDFLRGEDETQVEAGAVRCARPCTGRQRQYQRES